MQQGNGLFEIDDMNAVPGTENVRLHARIPAPGLMTEMNAGLKQLAHSIVGECHEPLAFSG